MGSPKSRHVCANALHHDRSPQTDRPTACVCNSSSVCNHPETFATAAEIANKVQTSASFSSSSSSSSTSFTFASHSQRKKGCYLVKSLNRSHFNFILIFCIDWTLALRRFGAVMFRFDRSNGWDQPYKIACGRISSARCASALWSCSSSSFAAKRAVVEVISRYCCFMRIVHMDEERDAERFLSGSNLPSCENLDLANWGTASEAKTLPKIEDL